MKWRHWSILIVLILLNYLIFSTAFTQLARRQQAGALPTRTPQPTFESVDAAPLTWKVLPTNTPYPTLAPILTPTAAPSATHVITEPITATLPITATPLPPATITPVPTLTPTSTPAPTPTGRIVVHVVKRGETLDVIAQLYGVTVVAIVRANEISNPNLIYTGQKLNIPLSGQAAPASTPRPAQTGSPTNTPTPRPPAPTPTAAGQQFTAELEWRPSVAPNCSGPGISSLSIVKDAAGNPVDGVVVEVNCYGNRWPTIPSGKPGVYEHGHYDWSPGQTQPVDWACTARVAEINGQPVTSSQEVSIHFDTNDCRPNKSGHQVAILNWIKWR